MGWHARLISRPQPAQLKISGGQPEVFATQHRLIEPGGAELSIVGSHPVIGQTYMPQGAVLSLTGGQPKVDVGRTISPSAAPLTLAGGQPKVTVNHLITPSGRSLTLTGGQPTVTVAPAAVVEIVGGDVFNGSGCSRSYNVTVPSTADCAVVFVRASQSGGLSASLNGVSMTSLANDATMAIFARRFTPGSMGTVNCSVFSGQCVSFGTFLSTYVLFFKNVASLGNGTTGSTSSVVTAPAGSMAVAVFSGNAGVSPTHRFNYADSAFNYLAFSGGTGLVAPGNTSVTMSGSGSFATGILLNQ